MSTKIEWTDETWNPTIGCTKVSPGCDHCYAKTMHERFNGPDSFETVTLHPDRLELPLRWRKPRKVFVNSMSDLFHQDIPDAFIARTFAIMALAKRHTFQVLTKRHARMRSLLSSPAFHAAVWAEWEAWKDNPHGPGVFAEMPWPLPNVWLGVSVENQQWADIRIPALLDTPATVRFLSCEPLLGPVDLTQRGQVLRLDQRSWLTDFSDSYSGCNEVLCTDHGVAYPCGQGCAHLDWVIVGGESGRGARPMHPDWARSLRDQCETAGVAFMFKQWGAYVTRDQMTEAAAATWEVKHGNDVYDPGVQWRMGKGSAGRELDGRTWDEFPEVRTA